MTIYPTKIKVATFFSDVTDGQHKSYYEHMDCKAT
jgi:hypothetical protein